LKAAIDLLMNTTATGNFISSTSDLSPGTCLAILQASTDTMTGPKTLASTTFEVKPSIEITKRVPDVTNLLVWVNDRCGKCGEEAGTGHCSDNNDGLVDIELLEGILKEAVTGYLIVHDKKDFQAELGNSSYTDFLILGDYHPIEDGFREELREKVYSGRGLISSLYLKHGERQGEAYDPVFGIKFKGYLPGETHRINLIESPVTAAGILEAAGKAAKVEADEGTTIAGWIETDSGCQNTKDSGRRRKNAQERKNPPR